MSEIISVLSGKGGTGKTFAATNLSLALQNLGSQVLSIDTDLDSPNLSIQLGHQPGDYTIEDILSDDANPLKAVHVHDSGAFIIPSSLSLSDDTFNSERVRNIVDKFSHFVDKTVIDVGPGFRDDFYNCLDISDKILVVTNPEHQALLDAKKISEEVEKKGKEVNGVILNKVENVRGELKSKEVENILDKEIIAEIPYHRKIKESVHSQDPLSLDEHNKIGIEFHRLASKISEHDYEPPLFPKFSKLMKKLGKN